MDAREELLRDLAYTERLLEYEGYRPDLRMKLLAVKANLERELATVKCETNEEHNC